MNPIFLMRINETNLTKSELLIMDYALNNLEAVSNLSINEFADNLELSKSAISRFCKKLGYHGYSQFKYDIKRYLSENIHVTPQESQTHTVASIYAETIAEIDETVYPGEMQKLKDLLLRARRVKVFGFSETGLTAKFFGLRLAGHGYDVEVVTHSSFIYRKVELSQKDDLLIFLSLSANTDYIKDGVHRALKNDIPTALVTQNTRSVFRNKVDAFIELPFFKDNPGNLILDSQVIMQTFCLTFINFLVSK
ncbi:MAG: MurR/RpiR family transcriptional regulator [Erysipelothrix sp.]|nr:MurR/RpiR family transcriptional regulator [Erysipelothrix sp.]